MYLLEVCVSLFKFYVTFLVHTHTHTLTHIIPLTLVLLRLPSPFNSCLPPQNVQNTVKIISLQRLSAAREENWGLGLGSDTDTECAVVTAAILVRVVVVVVVVVVVLGVVFAVTVEIVL